MQHEAEDVGTSTSRQGGERAGRWSPIALVVVTFAVFANSLHNGYHLDDHPRIVDNPEIDRFWPPWRHLLDPATSSVEPLIVQYRPLLPLTLTADRALADALGWDRLVVLHVVGIGLHALTVCLLFSLFDRLARRLPLAARPPNGTAFVAALLFAVHPVAGVAVNYLCARDLLLMQLFLVAALRAHVALSERSAPAWRYALPAGLAALSILSKTNTVALPLVVLFYELSVGGWRPLQLGPWLRTLPYVAVVVAFFGWTRWLGFSDAGQLMVDRGPLDYPWTQLALHVRYYLRNAVWPFHLRPLPELEVVTRPADPWSWLGLVLVAASIAIAWRWRHRRPLVALGLGAYWALLSPTSSVLPFRLLATDYRQHPALPWLCWLLALALGALASARVRRTLAGAMVAYLAAVSVWSNTHWRDEATLWGRAVRLGASSIAHHNYAHATARSSPVVAEHHYRVALALYPNNVRSRIGLGLLALDRGRTEAGLAHVEAAARSAPSWGLTHYWLARTYRRLGRIREAAAASARAAERVPGNPTFVYQAAYDASAVGDHAACLRYLETLHALRPSHELSRFLEGFALQKLGRTEEAVAAYREFVARERPYHQAHFNLAYALMELDRCESAVGEFERVLELSPGYREVHYHLSRCLQRLERTEEAEAHRKLWREGRADPENSR